MSTYCPTWGGSPSAFLGGRTATRPEARDTRWANEQLITDETAVFVTEEVNKVETSSPVEPFNEVDFNRFWKHLNELRKWETGWNGYDAIKPDKAAVCQAEKWGEDIAYGLSRDGFRFETPFVSAEADGAVVVEWRNQNKTLAFNFLPSGEVEYFKVWGPDITNEMEDGSVATAEDATHLLAIWLNA